MEEAFEKQCAITPRRSQRQRRSTATPQYVFLSPKKRTHARKVSSSSSSSESDSEKDNQEKPKALHDQNDLSGDKIFTFQTRKKCEAIIDKPKVKTQTTAKTPSALRNTVKKGIAAKLMEENESSGEDFSDSGSEYVASDNESETTQTSDGSSSDSSDEQLVSKNRTKPLPASKSESKPVQRLRRTIKGYNFKTDDYFSNNASRKILTSNHTLDKLETPRLPQDQLQRLLSRVKVHGEHERGMVALTDANIACFSKWMYLMHENVNILLYGLGSKKDLLNYFHEKCLKKLPAIVINGFFPSLTIKDILDAIISNLLELKENPANIFEACELIEKEFSYISDNHLYLVVHNIDMVRSSKAQNVFSRLAAVKNIHLIASIDHINAPLVWDHSKLSKFNFSWWDVTTFKSYVDETSFESSMMVQRTGTLALSSLRNVFLSLTSNSKGIYLVLVKYQIENGKKQYYQGLAFRDLYSLCREAFLVSSDLALRSQLSEFVDHKMVKFRRSADGTEYLIIPIPNTLLEQFLSEQSS